MWIPHFCIRWRYTARNILALFYMLHISFVSCCRTDFDSVQTRALLSQVVIVGKIERLYESSTTDYPSMDYKRYSADVEVLSIVKEPTYATNYTGEPLARRRTIQIDGFLKLSDASRWADNSITDDRCLSYVKEEEYYLLFINHTTTSYNVASYRNVQPAAEYTKTDKKLIKSVVCENCATPPNAKSKRNLQVSEGAQNYKITCRAEGNPSPNITWYKDNQEITSDMKGIHVKFRRRSTSLSIRIKQVKAEHAGHYQCVARSILGEDSAKTKLIVIPKNIETSTTPASTETADEPSHYITCTGERDKDYCLHGGQCKVMSDGRYKHCRCKARFTGTRCEFANILPPTPPIVSPTRTSIQESPAELVTIITALAVVLAILILLLCFLAFYGAGWRYNRRRQKRLNEFRKTFGSEGVPLVDDVDGREARPSVKQCQTTASQTEPVETSLQRLRQSLNLEDHFPRSSAEVQLRRKPSSSRPRPLSQPGRPTRQRLSGTSTLTQDVTERKTLTPQTESQSSADEQLMDTPPNEKAGNIAPVPESANHPAANSSDALTNHEATCDDLRISLHISESDLTQLNNNDLIQQPATTKHGPAQPYHLYNGHWAH